MGITATNTQKNLINCIYVSGTTFSEQLEAFLKASKKDILPIDISKTMPTDTQWHDIAKQLDISLKALINTDSIKDIDDDAEYTEESLVKILANNPKALVGAIVMEDKRIAHITQYTEILKFYGVDSAGLEKTVHTETPPHTTNTKDENFIS